MRINVLISCMYENSCTSILERSNIQTDVVVVNQCDINSTEEFEFKNKKGCLCHCKFINTTERTLSRSRNMAISNAWGDICYICDDDEWLDDDFEDTIIDAYTTHPEKSVIIFSLIRKNYLYPKIEKTVSFKQILQTSSVQITFRRLDIVNSGIIFDVKMGSGTGNGGGEENKFLMDIKRKGLSLYYLPRIIATVKSEDSQWFKGFNKTYFRNNAWANRRILGTFTGAMYISYWLIFNHKKYSKDISFLNALSSVIQGFFEKR